MGFSLMYKQPLYFVLAGFILGIFQTILTADELPSQNKQTAFFEKKIRPLLVNHCFRCHGPDRQRGDLRLDSAKAIKLGGSSGTSVVHVGHPEKSLLMEAVLYANPDLQMPPKGKLKAQEIADLKLWIKSGANFPAPKVVKGDKEKHWAFQAVSDPQLPKVKQSQWPQTGLDYFILSKLEAKDLEPNPKADKRTLIRRVTFDLIGLPPTPEEIADFLQDDSPKAFARVVDRLLASPHYGERWGRHWLDVARYADSNGLDENVAFGTAWRYRDYVVQALNNDMPYDRFVLEQIAGDLLPTKNIKERHRQLIATGFLSLGPKVLAEVDETKMEMDILDEQIDTFGRAFLGLTMGCARCHNHKFDPITMKDYYALQGIFKSTKTMIHFKKVAKWYENDISTPEQKAEKVAYDKKISNKKAEIEKAKKLGKPAAVQVKLLQAELLKLEKNAPELPTALGVIDAKPTQAVLLKRGNHLTPGDKVKRGFPAILTDQPSALPLQQSGRLELARWLIDKDHPLTSRVMVNRVWRWHFGSGLVRSTDNFGRLGEDPSHPQLLDWLAHRFMESGWSLKKLHRRIVLSSTYQMSSAKHERAIKLDPENRLLARFPIRRLEAEIIRDNILAASGLLDRKMGGSLLHVKNREYLFNHTSKDLTNYDNNRRSLYLPVIRNNLYDVYQLFDSTDATVSKGNRETTTVATQALFMLNSPLMTDASTNLAKTVLARKDLNDRERIRFLFEKAYGRLPTDKETERMHSGIRRFEQALAHKIVHVEQRRQRAWALVTQVLLASNEFIYIR